MSPRRGGEQDSGWTRRFEQGDFDAENADSVQRFSKRSKFAQDNKMRRTADLRLADVQLSAELEGLPLGEVIQVFSVYVEVLCDGVTYLSTLRRTLQRLAGIPVVVGDFVRIRKSNTTHDSGQPEAAIEQVLPRSTILARQDSFRKDLLDPIVANAGQMLIVTSILQPRVKWGLVERMLIAAESGKLKPIVCLNKLDLAAADPAALEEANQVMDHYGSLGIQILRTSIITGQGVDELRTILKDQKTVLAGHSGVGKSSLIQSAAPEISIRVGVVSDFNEKGRHTTTSARRYALAMGGFVIDTPGVKQFGLVDVTADTLSDFFPDVAAGNAPAWREESYQRILESL